MSHTAAPGKTKNASNIWQHTYGTRGVGGGGGVAAGGGGVATGGGSGNPAAGHGQQLQYYVSSGLSTGGGGVAVPSGNFTYQSTVMSDGPDNQKSAPTEPTTQVLQLQVDTLKKKIKELETQSKASLDQIKELQEAFSELWKKSSGQLGHAAPSYWQER